MSPNGVRSIDMRVSGPHTVSDPIGGREAEIGPDGSIP